MPQLWGSRRQIININAVFVRADESFQVNFAMTIARTMAANSRMPLSRTKGYWKRYSGR